MCITRAVYPILLDVFTTSQLYVKCSVTSQPNTVQYLVQRQMFEANAKERNERFHTSLPFSRYLKMTLCVLYPAVSNGVPPDNMTPKCTRLYSIVSNDIPPNNTILSVLYSAVSNGVPPNNMTLQCCIFSSQ